MTIPGGLALAVLGAFNALSLAAQGVDKLRAARGGRRIPERTLLLLGVPLAAPGMLLGMKLFRHKTRKMGFIARAAAVVFANLLIVGALVWLAKAGALTFEPRLY